MVMSVWSLFLILLSVMLSAAAQLLMKAGMSVAAVQHALGSGQGMVAIVGEIAKSPLVMLGLLCFGMSAAAWLLVLSKVDVSQAYPCVALGIVITAVGGNVLLGEPLELMRMVGIGATVIGVMIVALS